jgi:hypothetical protein
MMTSTPTLHTKLPKVGTTIFTVMSALATEHKAVNLGQGFPDFNCDPRLAKQTRACRIFNRINHQSPRFNAASSLQPTQHLAITHCMLMRARAFMRARASWQRPESGTGPLRAGARAQKAEGMENTEPNRAPSTSCR